MSVEDRRESILDAALPLLRERGADVTTREIADAAAIAEGTIFRAFSDKQEIIDTAVARAIDPAPTYERLREIDPDLSLEDTIASIVGILRERFAGLVGLMSILGRREHPDGKHAHGDHPHDHPESAGATIMAALLERHSDRMRLDPASAAHVIRVLVFGVSMPLFGTESELTTDDIVDFVLRGIVKEGA